MQSQRYIQLELPLNFQKMDTLEHMEQSIQAMLDLTWNAVLVHTSRPSTKKLMSDQGKLIALSDGKATIRFSSKQLYQLAQTKLPEIEAAFQKAFGDKVSISLEY
jgi:DNA polymerase-3 subunit gamma/tau